MLRLFQFLLVSCAVNDEGLRFNGWIESAMNGFIEASCPGDHSFALTGVKE